MANLQIRIDDELRDNAQQVATDLGMDLTTAVRMFLVQMVCKRGLPFAAELDPFYSPANQKAIQRAFEQLKAGQGVTKTLAELEDMEK